MSSNTIEIPDVLSDEIAKQLASAQAPGDVTAANLAEIQDKFCQHWPVVKTVLEFLKTIIPGGGIIIGVVISIGDGAHRTYCS